MWNYEKKLQFPINITQPNAELAKVIITQYGGPHSKRIEKLNIIIYFDCLFRTI